MKFKEIMYFIRLFGVISTFPAVINTFLGPTNILFMCVINTDNRIVGVLPRSMTFDIEMNKRLMDFQKTPFKEITPLIHLRLEDFRFSISQQAIDNRQSKIVNHYYLLSATVKILCIFCALLGENDLRNTVGAIRESPLML